MLFRSMMKATGGGWKKTASGIRLMIRDMHEVNQMARKIALLQLNQTVGDLAGNVGRIETLLTLAAAAGADAAVATELAISGYPPRDLLLQDDFVAACMSAPGTISTPIPPLLPPPPLCSSVLQKYSPFKHPHHTDCPTPTPPTPTL